MCRLELMHVCPWNSSEAIMAWEAASSTSASSRTMKALSPPSSRRIERRSVAAEAAMARPDLAGAR
ncbi:hypothetical protein [Streptosporangium vulgare]|uniref:hypothetical protein n=1 Tax=Streptosporangium vulgare TaxID=46190 RepID=UPI0031D8E0A1